MHNETALESCANGGTAGVPRRTLFFNFTPGNACLSLSGGLAPPSPLSRLPIITAATQQEVSLLLLFHMGTS